MRCERTHPAPSRSLHTAAASLTLTPRVLRSSIPTGTRKPGAPHVAKGVLVTSASAKQQILRELLPPLESGITSEAERHAWKKQVREHDHYTTVTRPWE